MKMARILITLLLSVAGFSAYADALTAEQLRFRDNIEQFLEEEGFLPSIDDSDNSVMFRNDGILHWINVAGSGTFYVEFNRAGVKIDKGADRTSILNAVNTANLKTRCAKAILRDSQITLVVEMFCHSAEEFRYTFYKNMSELERVDGLVSEATESEPREETTVAADDVPFEINAIEIANTDRRGEIITPYGSQIYSGNTQYLKARIGVNVKQAGSYTVQVKFYASGQLVEDSSGESPAGYSYVWDIPMSFGSGRYELIGWGGAKPGYWKAGSYRFEFYYKNKKIGEKSFEILR